MLAYQKKKTTLIKHFVLVFFLIVVMTQVDEILLGIQEETKSLKVVKTLQLPIREISGFSLNKSENAWTLDVVSDYEPTLYQFGWTNLDTVANKPELKKAQFGDTILSRIDICEDKLNDTCKKLSSSILTQWEAVYRDGTSRVVLLQEATNSLYFFSSDMKDILKVVSFRFNDQMLKSRKSLGEGLIVLNNDRFLVAKEKYPPQIVEFGPSGGSEQFQGPAKENSEKTQISVHEKKVFKGTLEPLAQWQLGGTYSKCDFSDLARNMDGSLYILSQQCNKIFLVELEKLETSKKNGQIKITRVLNLPSIITNAEALGVIDENNFVVGTDSKKIKDNIFFLKVK